MNIAEQSSPVKPIFELVAELAMQAQDFITEAVENGLAEDVVEQKALELALGMGHALMDRFFALQGDGDVGETVEQDGRTLRRSAEPARREVRTIFGEHVFAAYVYAPGPKKAIAFRPLDERMQLPPGKCSYLFEELSQYLNNQHAYEQSQACLLKFFGQKVSVNTLENINRRLGAQAADYLQQLPTPVAADEGELLVASADGKGVPLIGSEAAKIPAFEQRERKGNKRMATLGCVYSVDRYTRTADDILAALFRDKVDDASPKRPEAMFKHVSAHFASAEIDGAETVNIPGPIHAMAWIAEQVSARRRPQQPLIVLMDGQVSLWDAAATCLDSGADANIVEILDLLHVSQYVWKAASAFYSHREQREAFARDHLRRILNGKVKTVVKAWRQRATKKKLTGSAADDVEQACRYFDNNAERMRYDEYLAAGYPIASGVIEGACRHLVKDRMERSGMRWGLDSATAMLNNRSVYISGYWETFQDHRIQQEQKSLGRDPQQTNRNAPYAMAA